MLFFHRVVHMWGQPPARGAEGRCRAAAGLWTTRSGPAVGEEVHSLCVHALPQAVTEVGKQVFHRPRGPVGAGITPVDQDLPHVPNPVDNQGREGWLSTGGCGQLRGGTGEGAWGQSWGQSGDNLGGPGSAPRRGGGSRWGPSGPRPYVFRFSPRSRRRRLTTPAGSPYCSEDVRAESRPTPRGSRGSDRAAKPRAARLPIFRPGVHP